MIFAGVDYLFPIYREANRCANLFDVPIPGNPDHRDDATLHRNGWALVEPVFQADRDASADRFRELQSTEQASDALEDVLTAAHDGRVAVLFVARDRSQSGVFDPERRAVVLDGGSRSGGEDLLDTAAAYTFLHRGKVYPVPFDEMPASSAVAAIYRY